MSPTNAILSKISSYNIFNFLFPGVVFCYMVDEFTPYKVLQDDLVVGFFLYYFAGLVISRIGSLFIEYFLRKVNWLEFGEYNQYIEASKKDNDIVVLSEQNNMLRTLLTAFIVFIIIKLYSLLPVLACTDAKSEIENWILWIFLTLLFLFSYRKQTKIIKERIDAALSSNTPDTPPDKGDPS